MSAASQRRRSLKPKFAVTYERTGHLKDPPLTWVSGTGDRVVHDRILARMPVSRFIVGGGSIFDDALRIRTASTEQLRSSGEIFRFDAIVSPGGVRLNGPGLEHHHLTAKMLVNLSLIPGIGWCTSELSLKTFYRSFLLMVRWMVRNGIRRMDELRDVHFQLFREQFTRDGIEGLYPVLPALDEFLYKVKAGESTLPTYQDCRRNRLGLTDIAHMVGLNSARSLSPEATRRIVEVCKEVRPELLERRSQADRTRIGVRGGSDNKSPSRVRTTVGSILEPWERLHDLRDRLKHDQIGYRAFTPHSTRDAFASAIGGDTGRTRDIPHAVLGFLLDRALRWLDYADHIRELYDTARAVRQTPGFTLMDSANRRAAVRFALSQELGNAPSGPGAPSPMLPEYSTFWGDVRGVRENGLDLRTILTRLLPGACFILIAMFSARRKSELESLRHDCIVRDGAPWLLAWIGKTMREVDRISVPESVARAVSILCWLSEDARNATGEPWLFSFQELAQGKAVVTIKVVQAMNDFARFVGMDDFHQGERLLLAPHQMRRAFAILHFYKFRMPSLPALSFFLRHYDSDMTARYLTDTVSGKYLEIIEKREAAEDVLKAAEAARSAAAVNATSYREIAEDFLVDVLTLAERNEEPLLGKGGEAMRLELSDYVEAARKRISVTGVREDESECSLDRLIRKFVQGIKPRIVPNPAGTSYCICGSDPNRIGLANCLGRKNEREGAAAVAGANGPDFAYAEPSECCDCYNGVQLPENNARMADYAAAQLGMARTGAAAPLRSAAARRAAKIEKHRRAFYGPVGPADGQEKVS